ncbi:MAG: glutaredoxin [Bacilli bacterium]|nr:glutaredoxin [Bacilli bacterium]
MKKLFKLLLIVFCLFLITPSKVAAKEKVTVHLFWENGCPYCENAKEFFDSIKEEYSEYFQLKEYEVYSNQDNANLKAKVHAKFKMDSSGVPFIVIGDKYFVGYSSSSDEEIINTIKDQYNNGSTDVVQDIIDNKDVGNNNKESSAKILMLSSLLVVTVGFVLFTNGLNKKKN